MKRPGRRELSDRAKGILVALAIAGFVAAALAIVFLFLPV